MIIKEWKEVVLHSWSTRLAASLGAIAGVVGAHEIIAVGLLGFLPVGWPQIAGAAVVGFLAFGAPLIVARITKQPKLQRRIEDNASTD